MKIIGVIGCGNMGSAILRGLSAKIDKSEWSLMGCNRTPGKLEPLSQFGIIAVHDIAEISAKSDILILAVKPAQMDGVLREARTHAAENSVIVSVAAAFSLEEMRSIFGPGTATFCRCMPTTTAKAGRGIFAFCFEAGASDAVQKQIMGLFANIGYCLQLPENKFTDFSALIGAGPAYVFNMMRGLAQAGVTLGFSHVQSRAMIIELFAGCAALASNENKHFIEMSDDVCSPGGLTIAGVNKLDEAGFAGIIVDAVKAAAKRGKEMENK